MVHRPLSKASQDKYLIPQVQKKNAWVLQENMDENLALLLSKEKPDLVHVAPVAKPDADPEIWPDIQEHHMV